MSLYDVFKLKDYIDKITAKTVHNMNKNMRVFELNEEEINIFSKNYNK